MFRRNMDSDQIQILIFLHFTYRLTIAIRNEKITFFISNKFELNVLPCAN